MKAPGDRPWEQPRCFRLDCEPHWGSAPMSPAAGVLFCGVTSFLLAPGILALVLAAVVNRMALQDLAKIHAGQMDPIGAKQAERALYVATWGVVLALCGMVLSVPLILGLVGFLRPGP